MFNRLIDPLKQRWLLPLLSLAILTPSIWLYGPRLSMDGRAPLASSGARAGLIAGLLALFALYWGWRWFSGKLKIRVERRDGTDLSTEEKDQAEQLAQLDRGFAAARPLLRSRTIRQLPWYLLLGAQGNGKSALLTQSGQHIAEQHGLGACNWRFAEQAVWIDSSGPLPAPVWQRLLRLLRKARRRCPLNGVLITLSVDELLTADDIQREEHAQRLREQIKALHSGMGARFPVYVIVTQSDRLAGFSAFFSALNHEQRAQVWGMSFPLVSADQVDQTLAAFLPGHQALTRQLQARVIERMQSLHNPDERAQALAFPMQFAGLARPLSDFLTRTFSATRYQPNALLRGVYFVSAQQGSEAWQRWLGPLAPTLAGNTVAAPPGQTSYFISALLEQVILAESGLAGANLRLERWRNRLRIAAWLTLAACSLLMACALTSGYLRGQQSIARKTRAMAQFNSLAQPGYVIEQPASLLPLLDAARALTDRTDSARMIYFGRYPGAEFDLAALAQYHSLLRHALLPELQQRLAATMSDDGQSLEARDQALRLYLSLDDRARFDRASLQNWLRRDFAAGALAPADQKRLVAHYSALLDPAFFKADVPLDAALIARTQNALLAPPLAPKLFTLLRQQLDQAMPGQYSLSQMAGPGAPLALLRRSGQPLSQGVAQSFTRAGFDRYRTLRDALLADLSARRQALGRPAAAAEVGALRADLDALYYARYIQAWDALLADIALQPLSELRDSAAVLKLLSGPDSPLRLLVQAAVQQTSFTQPTVKGQPAPLPHPVDLHFAPLHAWLTPAAGGKPTPLDQMQAQMAETSVFMAAANSASDRGLPPPPNEALNTLQRMAGSAPGPLGAMLNNLVRQGATLANASERQRLTGEWRTTVASFCHLALDDRYPFTPASPLDVTRDDFARLFAPGGLIDNFFQKNLLASVDTSVNPWRARPTGVAPLRLTRVTLAMFQHAAVLRDTLFPDGGKTLSLRFDLTPLGMDAGISRFTLDLEGQTLDYAHGPPEPVTLRWPNPQGAAVARISYAPASDDGRNGFSNSGPWDLFRLLEHAQITLIQTDQLRLNFDLQGKPASVRLDADSVRNPFNPALFRTFRCLDDL